MARSRAKPFKSTRRRSLGAEPRVQLSKHDLSQLDTDALAALSHAQLQGLSEKLLADLKLAHERLDQTPHNSSRPPSSQAPWERAAGDGRSATDQSDPGTEEPSREPAPASADDVEAPADGAQDTASETPPSPYH